MSATAGDQPAMALFDRQASEAAPVSHGKKILASKTNVTGLFS